ncbi:MAG: tripartite tricarboxylate transporter TctB family protein [Paracoccus sp. (in: a-proteobacteria)]|uniref:tripartite tricarboxylate transporter TctB family protein n=1 Tax=Paracoccus sp. TaxID=267 RepID=UPI0026DEBADD|nr:tripartite tricarboxylate transporter TctB family protein [Paracoccus sp. (in: a-proteobacteria)]MDO5633063.1 tripartite tricarboxylate transporter TctB family protein [Paracoccus sp. (in: a-proteobacteria)]
MSDRIFGGLGLLFAVLYLWQASLVPDSFMTDAVGPRSFPYTLGIGLALSSIVILMRPDIGATWPRGAQLFELAMAVAVMGLYAWLLPVIGFIIATALASAYLSWRLGSSPITSLIFGAASSLGIYVVFKLVLGLSLARGPWGF